MIVILITVGRYCVTSFIKQTKIFCLSEERLAVLLLSVGMGLSLSPPHLEVRFCSSQPLFW